MGDLLTALSFIAMILAPCVVAMGTGVAEGAELGVRNPAELEARRSHRAYIPG
jgi:hypothetical protein